MYCVLEFIGIILEIFKNQVFFLIENAYWKSFQIFSSSSLLNILYIALQTCVTLVNLEGSSIKASTKEKYQRKIYYHYSDSCNPRLPT